MTVHQETKTAWQRFRLVALFMVVAVAANGCVLKEGEGYVIQPAPPNGIHVTIVAGMTDQLKLASDVVAQGVNIDAVLKDRNINTTCPDLGTRKNGDLCAFKILRSTKIEGGLVVAKILGNAVWGSATRMGEFEDFRRDSMTQVRKYAGSCVHLTASTVFIPPFGPSWPDYNWTYRKASDAQC